jgi:hypothetical protein
MGSGKNSVVNPFKHLANDGRAEFVFQKIGRPLT